MGVAATAAGYVNPNQSAGEQAIQKIFEKNFRTTAGGAAEGVTNAVGGLAGVFSANAPTTGSAAVARNNLIRDAYYDLFLRNLGNTKPCCLRSGSGYNQAKLNQIINPPPSND